MSSLYGKCPQCGAEGVERERRPNGNDKCANGHTYPSRSAVVDNKPHREQTPVEWLRKTRDALESGGKAEPITLKNAAALMELVEAVKITRMRYEDSENIPYTYRLKNLSWDMDGIKEALAKVEGKELNNG